MLTLQKTPGKAFTILNLTDPQLATHEWAADHPAYRILMDTLQQLIARVKPDLITVSGDISWGNEHFEAYRNFADLMHSYGIPWAPVWGNHDNDGGAAFIDRVADLYLTYDTCLYEKGDPALGNGNYVIAIKEGEKTVEAVFMMDTHSGIRLSYLDRNCVLQESGSYAYLTPSQMSWYRTQVEALKAQGCTDSTLIVHIPLYSYREAFYAATTDELRAPKSVSLADSYRGVGWKQDYRQGCFGINREGIASANCNDGVFAVLKECDHTRHVIAGHEHINNFSIPYEGIRLTYGTKLGMGCYWDADLNGGTVLTVTERGVQELRHEYVDVSHLLP